MAGGGDGVIRVSLRSLQRAGNSHHGITLVLKGRFRIDNLDVEGAFGLMPLNFRAYSVAMLSNGGKLKHGGSFM